MAGSGERKRYALLITRRIQAGEILVPGLNWRKAMRSNLSIKRLGLSISALLAVPYVLVMISSLFLVSLFTTGSWQAAFLGIGWSTIAGFEIGFIGVIILGFVLASLILPVYRFIQRGRPRQTSVPSGRSWTFRLLTTCLVLPTLLLVVVRIWAGVLPSSITEPNATSQAMNMVSTINTAYREAEPSFTADGLTMYFNCYNYDICVSHLLGTWEEGNWTPPEIVGAPISTEYEEVEPVINAAGDKLYFTSIRPHGYPLNVPLISPFMNVFRVINMLAAGNSSDSFFGGLGLSDVWVSYRINGIWSEPENINDLANEPHINTPFEDHCLFFSADGNEAFWTSTRPGGFGSDDIWTSRRVDDKWTEPENLGANVNSAVSEHTSILTPDDRSLYITTTRADGFGGEDNYVTTRSADGTWSKLVNLGPLINGSGDDRCPAWTPDLKIFLVDSVREGGAGARDIWWVYFEDVIGHPLSIESANSTGGALATDDEWRRK
jgi:hypothetical protein